MKHYFSTALIGLCLMIFNHIVYAKNYLPGHQPVPGGIAIVTIESDVEPLAHYNGQRVMIVASEKTDEDDSTKPQKKGIKKADKKQHAKKDTWLAIVGIPLSTQPSVQQLEVTAPRNQQISFTVRAKEYPLEHLTIADQDKVTPSKESQQRIAKEKKRISKHLAHWSDTKPLTERLRPPLQGDISSEFGLRRLFNQHTRSQHSGVDISEKTGMEIKAPAAGIVLDADDYFYTGNTVFLDHGQGLITYYAHLSEMKVQTGQHIAQGQVLGLVGETGRVTGPHLHWSVVLNSTLVDPLLFVPRKEVEDPISSSRKST